MIEKIKNVFKKLSAAVLFLCLSQAAWAVTHYTITAPAGIMAGDSNVTFTVTPMEGAAVDITAHRVKFVNLPAGVSVDPNDIINGVTIAGQTVFTLYANQSALAGSFNLRVEKSNAPNVFGQQSVTVYKSVTQFSIAPTDVPPFVGMAGSAFTLRVTARDADGAVVGAFKDDVDLAADIGDITVSGGGSVLWGINFNNGVALVSVVLYGTQIGSLENNITATARKIYPGQMVRAKGTMTQPITIEPNVFHHLILLFPGENINPGRISGKIGAANSATSGVPVSNVTVYLCDQFHNPIRTDRNPEFGLYPLTVSFSSNRPGDTVAAAKTFADINSINMNNEFIFITSAQSHEVTASENKRLTSDSSSVYVQSASASIFVITPVADPQSAVSPFNLTIIAKDGNNNVDLSYNKTVSVTGLWGTGNALGENTVDTNPATQRADGTITFVNGQWMGSIKVTRAFLDVYLRFDDNNGQVGESNHFRVTAGALSRLWITLPGEVFTEGAWPGNALGVSPNTFTAGDIIDITVRAVDSSWNLVAVPAGQQITVVSPNGVISAPVNFTMDPVGDTVVSGIQLRTAGQAQLLAASIPLTPLLNSNAFVVNPKPYNKLVLAAPGEQLIPGIFPADQPDGKTNSPDNQVISENFTVTVHAVDEYFNPINVGPYPNLNFSSTDPAAILSGGAMGSSSWPYSVTLNSLGVRQVAVTDGSKSDSVVIEVVPGPVQRYEISNITSPKDVNVPFIITINARDAFDNITPVNYTLDLSLSVGPKSLLPQQVTLVNGVWSGAVTCYGSGLNLYIRAADQQAVPVTGDSNPFNVRSGAYSKLLLLLNGETYTQGIAPALGSSGKSGIPTPTTAGEAVAATVIACDNYYNPVGGVYPTVQLSSDHIVTFAQNPITISTFDGVYLTSLVLKDAAVHTIVLRDVNNDGVISRSTSAVTGLANSFSKLLVLAPGQSLAPGTATGRSGGAIVQTAGIPFDLTVLAVDQYWNRVNSVNSESIVIGSSDGSIAMNPPFNQGYAFNNGEIVFTVHLGREGGIKVNASNASDATKTASETDIIVAPGASYRITAPAAVNAGQDFNLLVELIDSSTGLPGSFNHSFNMSAVLVSGSGATGSLNLGSAVLNNGVIAIPNQSYDYVETIKLKITDSYSRVHYSDAINVIPNGLYYEIATPVNAVAGPPSNFRVKVELKEQITGTPVKTMDHRIAIEVLSASTGLAGEGIYDVKETNLLQGISEFDMSYTKAENIFIRVWDKNNTTTYSPERTSAVIKVLPDTYKKLQIVAPGEVALPGVPSPTGKDSAAILKQKQAVPFVVSVIAVDQYWNLVTHNGGSVRLSSEDGSLGAGNPLNQGSAFVNGLVNFSISLFSAGNIKVTCQDNADLAKEPQNVYIPVSGAYYEVQTPTETYSGPPSSFAVTLILKDTETGSIIPANHIAYLVPLTPSKMPVDLGVLGVTQASLVNGIANIPVQTYNVAEDIIIKVSDNYQRVSFGNVIRVVPRQVELKVTAPDLAKVGPPDTFPVNIKLIDVDTKNNVARYNAVFDIEAVSADTGLTGDGALLVKSVVLSKGEITFTQAYSKSGGIFIKVASVDQNAYSNTITMIAGEPVKISVEAPSEIEAMQKDVFVEARLYDRFNNLVSDKIVAFKYSSMYDGIYLSADQAMTNASGIAKIQFVTDPTAREKAVVGAFHGNLSESKEITIKGAPQTSLFVANGINTEMADSIHIKENTPIALSAETGGLSLEKIMYSVNGAEARVYTGPFTLPVGTHVVSFFSVSVGAQMHTEAAKFSKTIYVSAVEEYKLVNFPNPFKAGKEPTFIEFYTNTPTSVKITIYNLLGQLVWEKELYCASAGLQRAEWWGKSSDDFVVSNGGYICVTEIKNENRILKRKIAVRK